MFVGVSICFYNLRPRPTATDRPRRDEPTFFDGQSTVRFDWSGPTVSGVWSKGGYGLCNLAINPGDLRQNWRKSAEIRRRKAILAGGDAERGREAEREGQNRRRKARGQGGILMAMNGMGEKKGDLFILKIWEWE